MKSRIDVVTGFGIIGLEVRQIAEAPNRPEYEYQVYLNFEPLTETKSSFYGRFSVALKKIKRDFDKTVRHPAFLGDGGPYLFEYLEYGRNIADVWVMSPEEYVDGAKYIVMCLKQKQKEMVQYRKATDRQAISDAQRSIGNLIAGGLLFLQIQINRERACS